MSQIPKNHDQLYFDTLCRTQKGESVLSLIHATYHTKKTKIKEEDMKSEIAKRLEYAYRLFRDNVRGSDNGSGSYTGELAQFDSQYTIGHEMGIWKNSKLDLSDLALEVAKNKITVKDYFDIVFLNYFQPVNNKTVHLLYHLLHGMKAKGSNIVSKEEMSKIYMEVGECADGKKGEINGAFNLLIASNYFEIGDNNSLKYVGKYSIDELISLCNITYVEKGCSAAEIELDTEEKYINYLTYAPRKELKVEEEEDVMKPQVREEKLPYEVSHEIKGINKMYFGAPGTGKSFSIKNFIYDEFKKDSKYKTEEWKKNLLDDKRDNPNVFRTTLHPEFTYNDFVGQLQPKKNGKSITYDFVPKIFTQALTAAIRHPKAPIFLILEELSRANVAAVFGDIFQLLDRGDDGSSEYSIDNDSILQGIEDIYQSYVVKDTVDDREVYGGYGDRGKKIFIPGNLFIIGTVNTSDQNVFVMDTAFKRRFEFYYMDANEIVYDEYNNEEKPRGVEGTEKNNFNIKLERVSDKVEELDTNWIDFYRKLNSFITAKEDKGLALSEDKQLGQFFLKFKENNIENKEYNNAQLYGKLLQYLWEDIKLASYSDKQLFDIELDTFSQAYRRLKDGKNVFHQNFMSYKPSFE